MPAVPGAEHAEAGRADSLETAASRAAGGMPRAFESRHPQSAGRRYAEPLSHGERARRRSAQVRRWATDAGRDREATGVGSAPDRGEGTPQAWAAGQESSRDRSLAEDRGMAQGVLGASRRRGDR